MNSQDNHHPADEEEAAPRPLEERVEGLQNKVRQIRSLLKSQGWDHLVEAMGSIADRRRAEADTQRGSLDALICGTELRREAETFDFMARLPQYILEGLQEDLDTLTAEMHEEEDDV